MIVFDNLCFPDIYIGSTVYLFIFWLVTTVVPVCQCYYDILMFGVFHSYVVVADCILGT